MWPCRYGRDALLRLVRPTIALFHEVQRELPPTPHKCHYTFSLRDVKRVVLGMLSGAEVQLGMTAAIRLWWHECRRGINGPEQVPLRKPPLAKSPSASVRSCTRCWGSRQSTACATAFHAVPSTGRGNLRTSFRTWRGERYVQPLAAAADQADRHVDWRPLRRGGAL